MFGNLDVRHLPQSTVGEVSLKDSLGMHFFDVSSCGSHEDELSSKKN